ncbi:PREDICTED: protein scribble homolog [Branchiostoma belcheri]|uniref:Protein scribble homolog n=1 Tax=Branchiostoma belcheri TaxID=7741 RepID=A0A6P5AMD3_BRABE|nr:PREDICTED: protein scribble homolog [Branchiostoma belcheri]
MMGKVIILWEQGNEVNASRYNSFNYINLSNQRLKTVPYSLDIHDPLKILLSHNRIETFPVSPPVMGCSKLTHLDLSHNLLSALREEIRLLSNLRNLNVSHNKLQSIPPGVYELLSLTVFDMSHNFVQQLPPTKFPSLEWLDLSSNKFQTVPDSILQTQSITYLNLLGNDISSLPADIVRLTNLDTLCYDIRRLQNLSHVPFELKTMPWGIEWTVNCNDMPNSTSAGNKIHFIVRPKVGYLQVKTNTKEVSECGVYEHLQYELNSTINCFEDTLREVNLSNCNIQSLPEQMSFLSKLTKLDVSNNRLSSFPITLPGLQSLQVLNVSNCSLTVLPESIGDNLPSLTSLDISRNNLKTLPNSLSNLPRLEILSLQYCGCHQVEFLANLTSLRYVNVDLAQLISIRVCCLDQLSAAGTTVSLIHWEMFSHLQT